MLSQLISTQDSRLTDPTQVNPLIHKVLERTPPDLDPDIRALKWYIGAISIIHMLGHSNTQSVARLLGRNEPVDRLRHVLVEVVADGMR